MNDQDPASEAATAETSATWLFRALQHLDAGRPEDALTAVEESRQLAPEHPLVWEASAQVLLECDRLDEALQAREKLLTLTPQNPDAWAALGMVLTRLDRHEDALAADRRAADLAPEDLSHAHNLAYDLAQLDRRDEAITVLARAYRLPEDHPAVWDMHAQNLIQSGRYLQVADSRQAFTALAPDNPDAWHGLAGALNQLGRHDEALTAHRRAADLTPDDPQHLHAIATDLVRLDRHDEALAVLAQIHQASPDDPALEEAHAQLLAELGRTEEALQAREKIAARSPDDPHAWHALGMTLTQLDRHEEALAADRTAAELAPDNPMHLRNLAYDLHQLGRHDEALALHRQATDLTAGDPAPWRSIADTLVGLGQADDEVAALRKLTESAPTSTGAWRALAAALTELDRDADALSALRTVTDLAPQEPQAWSEYGVALTQVGRHDDALTADQRAAELDPLNPQHQLYMGHDLTSIGHHEEACAAYRAAAELGPDNADLWLNQAAVLSRLDRHLDAADALARADAILPNNPSVTARRIAALHRAARPDDADTLLEDLSTNLANTVAAVSWRSEVSAELLDLAGTLSGDDGDGALACAELAAQIDPASEEAAYDLVRQLRDRHQPLRARHALDDSLQRFPTSAELRGLQGWLALDERDWTRAEQIHRDLVQEYPGDLRRLVELARILRAMGKPDQAEQILAQYPGDEPEVTFERGLDSFDQTDYRHAAEAFEYIVSETPTDDAGWANLLACHRLRRDFAAARDVVDRTALVWPDQQPASLTVARAWLTHAQGDASAAITALHQATNHHRTHLEAWRALTAILRLESAFDEARDVLAAASEQFQPEPVELTVERGWLAYDRDDFDAAAEVFEQLTANDPAAPEHWQALAECRRMQSDPAAGQDVLDRAAEVFPVLPAPLAIEAGWLAYDQGDQQKAATIFTQLVEHHPRDANGWRARIAHHRLLRHYDAAAHTVTEGLQQLPDEPQLLLENGWLVLDQSDYPAAAELFDKVLSITDQSVEAREGLIATCRLRRDFTAADAALEQAASTSEPAALTLQRGWLAMDRGDYDSAAQVFTTFLQQRPRRVQGWLALARCHRLRQDFVAAHAALTDALRVTSTPGLDLWLEQGWLSFDEEDYLGAEQAFLRAVEAYPHNPDGWCALSQTRRAARDFLGAQAALDAAATTVNNPPATLLCERGWLSYDQQDFRSADAILRQVLAQRPHDGDAVLALLDFLRFRGEFDEAQSVLDHWQAPGFPWLDMERGWVHTERRRWDEAAATFRTLTEQSPRFIPGWLWWAQLLRRQRNFDGAADVLDGASALFGDQDPQLVMEEGRLAFDRRQYDQAYALFTSVTAGPSALTAAARVIETRSKQGKLEEAERELNDLFSRYGPHHELLLVRGGLAYDRSEYQCALADFEEVCAARPGDTAALQARVDCLRHLGELSAARRLAESTYQQYPNDIRIRTALALVCTEQHKRGADDANAERAIELAESLLRDAWEPAEIATTARIMREAGHVERAEQLIEDTLRAHPRTPELCRERAALRIWQSRTEDALAALQDCLECDPLDRPAMIWTAVILRRRGRWDDLREHIDTALQRMPSTQQLQIEHGWLLYHEYRYDEALTEFRKARALSPSLIYALVGESRCLCALGRHLEATAIVRAALVRTDNDHNKIAAPSLTVEMARILHDQRLAPQALSLLGGPSCVQVDHSEAAMERIRVLLSLKHFDRAEEEFGALAERGEMTQKLSYAVFSMQLHGKQPTASVGRIVEEALNRGEYVNAEMYGYLGAVAQKDGDLRTAEAMYRLALKLDRFSQWRIPLAEVLIRSARYPDADTELHEALRLEPTSVNARHWLGLLQYETGSAREAELTFRTVLAINSNHPGSICGLAAALVAQDQEGKAERELKRAVERLPQDEDDVVLVRLASVLIQRGDQTGDESYYRQAAAHATKVLAAPDPHPWGLDPDDVKGEAHYLRGVAHYKVAEASLEPRTVGRFRREAQKDFEALQRMPGQQARYPDADRLRESLSQNSTQAALVALPGYAVAIVCVLLVAVLWYEHFFGGRASDTLTATLTPILLGLAAVAMLYPVLARLKLPGFEADIRQPQLSQFAASSKADVTFGTPFLGASPQDSVTVDYGGLGEHPLGGSAGNSGSSQLNAKAGGHTATATAPEAAPPGMQQDPADPAAASPQAETPRSDRDEDPLTRAAQNRKSSAHARHRHVTVLTATRIRATSG